MQLIQCTRVQLSTRRDWGHWGIHLHCANGLISLDFFSCAICDPINYHLCRKMRWMIGRKMSSCHQNKDRRTLAHCSQTNGGWHYQWWWCSDWQCWKPNETKFGKATLMNSAHQFQLGWLVAGGWVKRPNTSKLRRWRSMSVAYLVVSTPCQLNKIKQYHKFSHSLTNTAKWRRNQA